ncbi:hypothetical protein ACFE04_029290 [Oxalis oulophora]
MTHLYKVRTTSVLKWVSSNLIKNHIKSIKVQSLLVEPKNPIGQNPRFYATKTKIKVEKSELFYETSNPSSKSVAKILPRIRKQAEAALMEYLHHTRSLQVMDAEHISKNSPMFLQQLVRKVQVKNDDDIRKSLTRYLRYHPINEYEPFFESLGLQPAEYADLISHDRMFLSDDPVALENFHVLFNYGIARDTIGMIYKSTRDVFKYKFGILHSDLQALEKLGFRQDTVSNLIASCPRLLIGDMKVEFIEVVERLKSIGFELSWIEKLLLEHGSLNCSLVSKVLNSFEKMGFSHRDIYKLISRHPGLLSDASSTVSVICLLCSTGIKLDEMQSTFLQFPEIEVEIFLSNFRKSLTFLNEIEMDPDDIANIIRVHPVLLGSLTIRKTKSLICLLHVGKNRLREYIQKNPEEMKKWVKGSKVEPIPGEIEKNRILKTKFLLGLGFEEGSNEMEKACEVFKGKGGELPERFDCIVKAGLDREDAAKIIKANPYILSLRKEVIETRLDFLVNDLGLPLSTFLTFPSVVCFTTKRVKLRWSMCTWLKDTGAVGPWVTLSTVVTGSDKQFIDRFVKKHPKGLKMWQKLNKEIGSE